VFEGEYFDDHKWKGKYYHYHSDEDEIDEEYEYLNGKKNGKVIEYFKGGKIKFEGEYLNDKKWQGKGYNPNGDIVYEINNGKESGQKYEVEENLSD